MARTPPAVPAGNILLKSRAVCLKLGGISNTTLWRIRKNPDFPLPVELRPGVPAWLEGEVDRWIASRRRIDPEARG